MASNQDKKLLPSHNQYDLRNSESGLSDIGFQSYKNGILGGTIAAAIGYGMNSLLAAKNKAYANLPKTFRFYFWTLFSAGTFFYWVEETETSRVIETNSQFANSLLQSDEDNYIKHLEDKKNKKLAADLSSGKNSV